MEPVRRHCAGGIVLGDSGTIAVVRKRAGMGWFFPKGGIEDGETDEEAARREIEEETGLTDLELIDDLGTYERYGMKPGGEENLQTFKSIHMYLFAAPMHAPVRGEHDEAEAQWLALKLIAESLENAKDRAWFVTVFERVRQAVQRD
ncbi:MAG: hypothetical protein AB199_01080 [Parcubacteria bacterium C7867-004]|nr:MAG: hypothetical protein AB199_01080 [Parcubacteria bacterium C7867-004]